MKRVVLLVVMVCALAASGCRCCHWQPFRCAGCGPGMGCGEWYFGDWHECCEPCDCHGNWIGGCHGLCGDRGSSYGEPYGGGYAHEAGTWGGHQDYVAGPYYDAPYYDAPYYDEGPAVPVHQASRRGPSTARRRPIATQPLTRRRRHAEARSRWMR